MHTPVKEPKHLDRIANWPVLALLALLSGFVAPCYCLDRPPSGQGTDSKAVRANWVLTGNLSTPRAGHTATLLPNGKVLVVGGRSNNINLASAELYDTLTGTWSNTGRMSQPRTGHTATILPNGRVLVTGGDFDIPTSGLGVGGTSELYDPSTGTWAFTGQPVWLRGGHTATLLQNGKVLVAGGFAGDTLKATELYDPGTGTWSRSGDLVVARYGHTATQLQDGKVLVAGGSNDGDLASTLTGAELYDPVTGTWSTTGSLVEPVYAHTATLLPSGKVLVAGGYVPLPPRSLNASELYDPTTATWSLTGNLNGARSFHSATLLPNGQILVAGGYNWNARLDVNGAELYDPSSALWTSTGSLNVARNGHTATLLPGGRILIAGGSVVGATYTNIALDSAELYQQPLSTNSFRMTAIFSDRAGFYQYVQLQELSGLDNQNHFAGLTLEVRSRHGTVKSITFPNDLPSGATAGRSVLIGTSHVGLPEVDFTLPPQFLPTDGGTLVFAGVDVWDYNFLPDNGYTVFVRGSGFTNNPAFIAGYVFRPFTGFPTGLIAINGPVIEFYNQSLDHYFISMSQPDIDALDTGRFPGWKRTGESFDAWTAKSELGGEFFSTPPGIGPVCRLYLPPSDGDSHFFSASVAECNDSRSMHTDYVLETSNAFLASLPNTETGECLYGQTPVYRLWNARVDSNHRFTTSTATRDLMLSRGYVAEGYGPNAVTMCVDGGIPGSGN